MTRISHNVINEILKQRLKHGCYSIDCTDVIVDFHPKAKEKVSICP